MDADAFKKLTLKEKFVVVISALVVLVLVFALFHYVLGFYTSVDLLMAPCNRCLEMNPQMIPAIQRCQIQVSGLNLSAIGLNASI